MRSTVLIVALALAAGALGLAAGRWWTTRMPEGPPGLEIARIGDAAPDLSLFDLDGQPRRLGEWNGRARVINFWASWCGPCIEEMPLLDDFAQRRAQHGIEVIGIALDERAAVEAFLDQIRARYPQLIEAAGRTDSSVRLGNTRNVLPYSVLIGADDRIRGVRVGAFSDAEDLAGWATRR
jgi:thiol-disulfide isomerase/thioredoxin